MAKKSEPSDMTTTKAVIAKIKETNGKLPPDLTRPKIERVRRNPLDELKRY